MSAADILGWVALSGALKWLDIPGRLGRLPFPDHIEEYERLGGNEYARKSSNYSLALLRVLPRQLFRPFSWGCDLATAYLLEDASYFLCSAAVGDDLGALENLGMALAYSYSKREQRKGASSYLFSLSMALDHHLHACCIPDMSAMQWIFMAYRSAASIRDDSCYLPSISSLWYFHMHMFDQYRTFHQAVAELSFLFLSALSVATTAPWTTRCFISLAFKPCTYKNYLLLWKVLRKEYGELADTRKAGDMKVHNFFEGLGVTAFVVEHILWWLLGVGVGNMNFLCWVTQVFIGATFGVTLYLHIAAKSQNAPPGKEKAH